GPHFFPKCQLIDFPDGRFQTLVINVRKRHALHLRRARHIKGRRGTHHPRSNHQKFHGAYPFGPILPLNRVTSQTVSYSKPGTFFQTMSSRSAARDLTTFCSVDAVAKHATTAARMMHRSVHPS